MTVKGSPVRVFSRQALAASSDEPVDCTEANAIHVEVFALGGSPSADISVLGAIERGGNYLALPDLNATQAGVNTSRAFDVIVGQRWVKLQLTNVTGSFTIYVTPYVSGGMSRVAASISVDTLAAITANIGSANISDVLTIGTNGGIFQGTGSFASPTTGLKIFNSGGVGILEMWAAGTRTVSIAADGSGYLGSSSVFSWTDAGVVSLNGSAVMPNTIVGGHVNYFNVPIIDGLVLTNNSPSAGYVAWNEFTLTHQGTSYTITAGNSNKKFIYWNKATSTTVLQSSDTPPTQAADQFIIAFNETGTGIASLFSNIVYADYISATTLAAIQANIGAATISDKLSMPGASGAIAIGTTPPTSASAGTGIWIDRTGMYGLAANVQQAIFSAATGAISAGAGNVVLDSAGILIKGYADIWTSAKLRIEQPAGTQAIALYVKRWGSLLGFYTPFLECQPVNGVWNGLGIGQMHQYGMGGANLNRPSLYIDSLAGDIYTHKDGYFYGGLNLGTATGAAAGEAVLSGAMRYSFAWTEFTPSWYATGGSPAFNNAVLDCFYTRIGNTVTAKYKIVFGNTTSFAGTEWQFTLPVTGVFDGSTIANPGAALLYDSSGTVKVAVAVMQSTTRIGIYAEATASAQGIGSTVPFTWAAGDYILATITYEV